MLDASDLAAGLRVTLRALERRGAEHEVEHVPADLPVAVDGPERTWLGRHEALGGPATATVQRTLARLLTPLASGIRVGWVALPGTAVDRETLLRLRQLRSVWVPGEPDRWALIDAGLDPECVHVVPEPVDLEIFRPDTGARPPEGAHGTRYLAMAGTHAADGLDVLLRAWAMAFDPGDDVTLVMAPGAGAHPVDVHRVADLVAAHIPRRRDAADLVVVPGALSERTIAGLMAGADVVVIPHRAPGLRRCLAQARALARPAVGAAAGGVHAGIGWPVDVLEAPSGATGVALLDLDPVALAAALVEAHRDAGQRAVRGAAASAEADVHDHLRIADLVLGHLRSVTPPARGRARLGATRVVLEGPILDGTAVAGVNRELAAALADGWGVELAVVETSPDAAAPLPDDGDPLVRAMGAVPGGAPHVLVRSTTVPTLSAFRDGAVVQYVHWALGAPPREWRAVLDAADEVWVASPPVRDELVRAGAPADRVVVMPPGVDTRTHHPGVAPAELGPDAPGLRLLVACGDGWTGGADLLVQAVSRAFTPDDPVTLVLAEGATDAITGVRTLRAGDVADPAALMTACHGLVHPHRGMAPDLTILRAMACGLTVIGPAGEPLTERTGVALAVRPVAVPADLLGDWTVPGTPTVGEVDVAELAAALRAALDDPVAFRARGRGAAQAVAHHGWDRTAGIAADRLRMLAASPTRRH